MLCCRFKVIHVLSQGSLQSETKKGHLSTEILEETIQKHLGNTGHKQEDIFITICGPTLFTNLAEKLLLDIKMKKEQIYLFLE